MWNPFGAGRFRWEMWRCRISRPTCAWSPMARQIFPGPKAQETPGKPPIQSLFDLKIAQLRLEDGEILWNDTRVPLAAEGGHFEFAMDYGSEAGQPVYLGRMSWQQFEVAALRYMPFTSDFSAKFTLRPDSFSLTQLQWKIPHAEIDAQADLASFSQPEWSFRYRGQMDFEDLRSIMRKPNAPDGRVGFTGEGRYAKQQVSVDRPVHGRPDRDEVHLVSSRKHFRAWQLSRGPERGGRARSGSLGARGKRHRARARGYSQAGIPRRNKSSRTRPASGARRRG